MIDFPAFLVGTPCVVLGAEKIPTGIYDTEGNCTIKVPYELTRPDGVYPAPKQEKGR